MDWYNGMETLINKSGLDEMLWNPVCGMRGDSRKNWPP